MNKAKERFYEIFKKAGDLTSADLAVIHDYITELETRDLKQAGWIVAQFEAAQHILAADSMLDRIVKELRILESIVDADAPAENKIKSLKNNLDHILNGKDYDPSFKIGETK